MDREIEAIALEAGALALSHFAKLGGVSVTSKGHLDLVTIADQQVEALIGACLAKTFPDDGIFGEEGSAKTGTSGRTWVVDPIDGTFNFVRGGDQWAVSIGLYDNGKPSFGVIHAPARQQTFTGGLNHAASLNGVPLSPHRGIDSTRTSAGIGFHPAIPSATRFEALRYLIDDAHINLRLCGATTLALMELARGEVDGYFGMGESSWDVMAALPILGQLGVSSTIDWAKTPLNAKLRFACGTPDFLALIAPIIPPDSILDLGKK